MEKTWMPTVAGILDIIAGSLGLIVACGIAIIGSLMGIVPDFREFLPVYLLILVVPLVLVKILAIIGGIYTLRRKNWGLALAASIAAFLPFSPLGLAAIVLTALSKKEFE